MPTTLEDLKNEKTGLEKTIRDAIRGFEKKHGVSVDDISLGSYTYENGSQRIAGIEIEITL